MPGFRRWSTLDPPAAHFRQPLAPRCGQHSESVRCKQHSGAQVRSTAHPQPLVVSQRVARVASAARPLARWLLALLLPVALLPSLLLLPLVLGLLPKHAPEEVLRYQTEPGSAAACDYSRQRPVQTYRIFTKAADA